MIKKNVLELFAGCGGMVDGFEQSGKFTHLACVEWNTAPIEVLRHRLKSKYKLLNVDNTVIQFDIQRTDELINGWNDPVYGSHKGLKKIINKDSIDIIAGGPPCQAYSLAGRIQDKNGMHDDYRNFLFESYIKIVDEFKPKIIVFENVEGMLSANPKGINIVEEIKLGFNSIGYELIDDVRKYALLDLSDFGIPQKRKRVILVGIHKEILVNKDSQEILKDFYINILIKYKEKNKTIKDAIGDLEKLKPLEVDLKMKSRKYSHGPIDQKISGHYSRYHNKRDIEIFKELSEDIEYGYFKYKNVENLKKLYTEKTGKTSNVHKYNVLEWDKPSNTITAHLKKDGLRYIHPDSEQARTITVREAARIQTFDDDFIFSGKMTNDFEMIGNAVPPIFARKLAKAIDELMEKHEL